MEEGSHTLQSNTSITDETKSYKKQGNEEILKVMKRLEDKNQQLEKLGAEKSELSEVTQVVLDYAWLLCKDIYDKCAQVTGPEELKEKHFLAGKLTQEKEKQLKRVLAEKMAGRKKSLEENQYDRNPDNYLRQTLQSQSENAFKLGQQLSKFNRGGDEVWNVMMALEKANQNLQFQKINLEEKLNELTKTRAEESDSLKALQLENEKLSNNIQQLQNQQQQKQSTLEEELNRLKAQYFDEQQSKKNEWDRVQKAKQSLDEKLMQAIEEKKAIENQLNELKEKYDLVKEKLVTDQVQIEKLTGEKKNLEKNLADLQVLKEEKEGLAKSLLNQKNILEEEKQAVEKDNETLKSELSESQSKNKNLTENLESYKKEISGLKENLTKVSKKKDDLKEERKSFKDEKLNLKEKLAEITKNKKQLEEELEQTRAKLSKGKEDFESHRDFYEKKILGFHKEMEKITIENNELKKKCQDVDMAKATQEICKWVQRLESMSTGNDEKLKDLENKINTIQSETNKSDDQVNNLRGNDEENHSPKTEQQCNREEQKNPTQQETQDEETKPMTAMK